MFLGAEIRLDVGFNAAQARLANLARGGLLRRASHDAYDELGTGLARIGRLKETQSPVRPRDVGSKGFASQLGGENDDRFHAAENGTCGLPARLS